MMNNNKATDLHFVQLPAFADWLLMHINEYTTLLLGMFYDMELPLLKAFQHLSEDEKFAYSKQLNIEFLTNLSQNNAAGHIDMVTSRWLAGQLQNIGRADIEAKDITLINYIRSKAQKKFINHYTTDLEVASQLHDEIDYLSFSYNSRSINDYLQVLKNRIKEEANFSQRIIEASPGITFIFDLVEGRETYITGRVEDVTGFTPEDVVATKDLISQFTHPEDIPVVADFLKRVTTDPLGKTHQADYRFKNKKGDYQWMRCYAVVYKRDSQGLPLQILGIAFDVSREKRMALSLQRREQELLEAQSIGLIGSYEWNIESDKTITTPQVLRILEADRHLNLRDMFLNIYPDDAERVTLALQMAFEKGDYHIDFRYRSKSGIRIIDAKGVVLYSSDGKPQSIRGTLQDITEQKRIEESLRQRTLDLERSNEQLQQFASIASHDLKEPLRKISLYSNIIISSEWDELSERTKTNMEKISDSAIRMQKLIEGVLSYSSITEMQQKQPAQLEAILQEAIENLDYKIKETGAVITSDGLTEAEVVPLQMQQLFQNLISNALKFSKKLTPPEVFVTHKVIPADGAQDKRLQLAKQYLQISVADNGIGFDNEAAGKIFGLFQRLHGRSDYEGSGIGLAICKRIVENHGGTIAATAEAGVGATFTVTLPL